MARIMVVEDDIAVARGVLALLRADGHAVDHLDTAEEALEIAGHEPYDLFAVDLGLPGMSGIEFVKNVRAREGNASILILTARDAIEDKVRGLDAGADDYLPKPFDPAELRARVRALLRRHAGDASPLITIGELVCDPATNRATVGTEVLDLRRREWAVLVALARRAGTVVAKDRLAAEVFDYDDPVGPNALEVYVARVRKKLLPLGPHIRTLRGLGYIMETP
jgi:two-component system OmpR family response regulator